MPKPRLWLLGLTAALALAGTATFLGRLVRERSDAHARAAWVQQANGACVEAAAAWKRRRTPAADAQDYELAEYYADEAAMLRALRVRLYKLPSAGVDARELGRALRAYGDAADALELAGIDYLRAVDYYSGVRDVRPDYRKITSRVAGAERVARDGAAGLAGLGAKSCTRP